MKLQKRTITRTAVLTAFIIAFLAGASAYPYIGGISVDAPSEVDTGEEFSINADITGNELKRAKIQRELGNGEWEKIGESGCLDDSCTVDATTSWDQEGTQTYRVKAVADGVTEYNEFEVTFTESSNENPVAGFTHSPGNPEKGEAVYLNANCVGDQSEHCSYDPDGSIDTYLWDLDGDNTYGDATGSSVTKSFQKSTEVGLRVRDDDGNYATTRRTITVEEEKDLSVTLIEPTDGNQSVQLEPRFIFQGGYGERDGEDSLEFVLKLEKGKYSDPFTNPDITRTVTTLDKDRSTIKLDQELEPDTEYSWGVTVKHGEKSVNSGMRRFRTKSELKASIENYGPRNKEVRNPVTLWIDPNQKLENSRSDYSCYASTNNQYVTEGIDHEMKYHSDENRFELEKKFSTGKKTVYFQCFGPDWEMTNKVNTTFTVKKEEDTENPIARLNVPKDRYQTGELVTFDASDSSDNRGVVRYEYDFDNDGDVDRTTSKEKVKVSFQNEFTGFAKVTAFDEAGNSDLAYDWYKIRRNRKSNARITPKLEIKPFISKTGETVTFDASASSAEIGIDYYKFDFNSDGSYEVQRDYNGVHKKSFGDSYSGFAKVKIVDENGNSNTTRDYYIVEETEKTEIVNKGPSGTVKNPVTLSVKLNKKGSIYNCHWDNDNTVNRYDEELNYQGNNKFKLSRTFSKGTHTISFQCFREERSTKTVNTEFTVSEEETEEDPVAKLSVTPSVAETGETVTFDASGSYDTDGEIETYRFDYDGDGNYEVSRNNPTYTRSFSSETSADAKVKVIDNDGRSDTATDWYTVISREEKCNIQTSGLKLSKDEIEEGETVEAKIRVDNRMDSPQELRVKFEAFDTRTRTATVSANSKRTFRAEFQPDEDITIKATVRTSGGNCGDRKIATDYGFVEVDGRENQQRSSLTVNVEDDDSNKLDARVEISNGEDHVRYTGNDGETRIELEPGSYSVEVSKDGYETKEKDVYLSQGEEEETDFTLKKSMGKSDFTALVEDSDGDRLEDAKVEIKNGERKVERTNWNGRADFQLEPDEYKVTVSKDGYYDRTRTVELGEKDSMTEIFTLYRRDEEEPGKKGLVIENIDHPSSVCRGDSMKVDVTVRNRGGFHEFVTVTGKGLGSINVGKSFTLAEGDSATKSIRFTNIQGSGSEEFTMTVNNHDSDSETRTVDVRSCAPSRETGRASDLTLRLEPTETRVNQPVKASGYVDGVNGRAEVRITANGRTVAEVTTQPDGYFTTYFRPTEVGQLKVEASTGNQRETRTLKVKATSNVAYAKSPQKVFQGESFQVCGEVNSQVTPKVYLQEDGKIVESKNQEGEVCFNRTASEVGTHKYEIVAWAYGQKSVASTTTEILETDSEVENFPDKIASVESGSGMVKVRLYNTNDKVTRYHLSLEGLPDTWTSQTEKEVVLAKGERKEVVFYVTPEEEGTYRADLKVRSRGNLVHQQEVNIWAGGTKKDQKGFLESFFNALPF